MQYARTEVVGIHEETCDGSKVVCWSSAGARSRRWRQTAQEKPSVDVRRVGARLACQCGCKDSVATCSMFECHFSKPAKERIAQLQGSGVTDEQIIDEFVQEYGQAIYRRRPMRFGWIVPYASLVLGVVVIWWFIKQLSEAAAARRTSDAIGDRRSRLAKYKDQIEKDLANLD